MAKVILAGLEDRAAGQLAGLLIAMGHGVRREKHNVPLKDLLNADMVFVGGGRDQYLYLLRRVRAVDPVLPLVVVARLPETAEWLDALEAGATDYFAPPFEVGQLQGLMESALPRIQTAVA